MIGLLEGTPVIEGNSLIILNQGVGYLVTVAPTVLISATSLAPNTKLTLYIHTHVREEALELYGFRTAEEKRLFLLLLAVSGVGPRIALAISDFGSEAIINAVQTADVSFFSKISRVGKKLAQKIIIDLKSKLGSLQELQLGPTTSQQQDVVLALTQLGFGEQEILTTLRVVDTTDLKLEDAVKKVIQNIGKV